MIAPIVRRVRLPAHKSSPGAARAAIRAVIAESMLDAVADEALLLTTELSTNSVIHAGTEVELEIVADADGLTVTVLDLRSGPLSSGEWASARDGDGALAGSGDGASAKGGDGALAKGGDATHGLGERGRGLLLVDRLSSCWGTLHYPTGKGVWFRLDRPGGAPRDPVMHGMWGALTGWHKPDGAADWLTFLAEVSQLLAQSLEVDLTLALIPRLVVPRLGRWCAVHATDTDGRLRLAAATHTDEADVPALVEALLDAQPQLLEALHTDAVVPLGAPVEGYVVALIARGQQLGTLSVGRGVEQWQGTEEVAVVEDLARRAALAIDNARIHAERRTLAATLQRSLLPPQLPKVAGVEFGAEYVPAGEGVDVGGDFYDVVVLSDHRWLVVVGDVSGKGVHAATVTGLVRDVTRVLVRDGRTLPEALDRLNETLLERGAGRFCTLVLAAVTRLADGLVEVTLHLAGHDKPVLIHANGATALVGECGTALGLLDRVVSPPALISLRAGDTLVFYTDGVTERRRGAEFFGVDRLCDEAGTLAGFPAEVVAARLRAATLNFSPEAPRDDIAIFTVRNDALA